ncbi:MAG: RcpC/CpaB family pilus assembly protein [Acidimicrobiales bacterium]
MTERAPDQIARSAAGGVLASLILVVVGIWMLRSSTTDPAETIEISMSPALVVVEEIPRGTLVDMLVQNPAGRLEVREVPTRDRPPGAFADIAELGALVGELDLVAETLAPGTVLGRRSLAPLAATAISPVPAEPDRFEVALVLDSVRAGGGLLVPGSTVTVVASVDAATNWVPETAVVAAGLQVTRVEESNPPVAETDPEATASPFAPGLARGGEVTVTLEVDVDQLERLVWSAEFARIRFALQGSEASVEGSSPQNRWTVLGVDVPDTIGGFAVDDGTDPAASLVSAIPEDAGAPASDG